MLVRGILKKIIAILIIIVFLYPQYSASGISGSGQIEIISLDENENPVDGVEYELINEAGTVISTQSSDSSGSTIFDNLENGSYIVSESNVPFPYQSLDVEFGFKLLDGNNTKTITNNMVLQEFGKIEIVQVDVYGNPLPGFEYNIYDENGNLVDTIITDENGHAVSDQLPKGTYYIVQTSVPNGYQLDSTRYQVSIGVGKLSVLHQSVVEKYSSAQNFYVLDEARNGIEGIKYNLYDSSNVVIERLVSNSSGSVTVGPLRAGQYYLSQSSGILGFEKNNDIIEFTVGIDGSVTGLPSEVILNATSQPVYSFELLSTGKFNLRLLLLVVIGIVLVLIRFSVERLKNENIND